ncbi:MAG: hypothetical protein E7313_04980 [Clostridiales bacterium]|nr:hypothetical protein [Clostridiales bacterium]
MYKYKSISKNFDFSAISGSAYSNIQEIKQKMFDLVNEQHGKVIKVDTLFTMGNPTVGCGIVSVDYEVEED